MPRKAGIGLSAEFVIAETDTFQKDLKRPEIVDYVYPQLRINPYYGLNIKRLRGELEDFYRYRLGRYRLFYQIDEGKVVVFIITVKHRKDAYR